MGKIGIHVLEKLIKPNILLKLGFNFSPVYRRTTGRVCYVSDDLRTVKIRIPLTYKNRNYVGTMFGGTMSSATDPIYMIQLIKILGNQYVVWDTGTCIRFKRPVKQTLFAEFYISEKIIAQIKNKVKQHNETRHRFRTCLTTADGSICTAVEKEIYIASKAHHKLKWKQTIRPLAS